MASIVSAGTTSATALNMSADTSGVLQLASNNGTVALTVATNQSVGIGTTTPDILSRGYGTVLGVSNTGVSGTAIQINSGTSAYPALEFGRGGVRKAGITAQSTVTEFFNTEAVPMTFATDSTERMRISSTGNVLVKATSTPSGVTADTFFLLTAGSSTLGTANASGYIVYTKTIAQGVATTLITPADIDKWAGVIFISYVRDADQNRAGMMMVRYAYNRTYTTLLDSSQNSGAVFSVSANNLQVTLGGAGSYFCEIQIWGGAGP